MAATPARADTKQQDAVHDGSKCFLLTTSPAGGRQEALSAERGREATESKFKLIRLLKTFNPVFIISLNKVTNYLFLIFEI